MEIKGTYHCQTTKQPNALNSWDIRSVSVGTLTKNQEYSNRFQEDKQWTERKYMNF